MYTHELGLGNRTPKAENNKNQHPSNVKRRGEGKARGEKGERRKKGEPVAAARRGPEPRPLDSEPDLIGVGRRELERGGHRAGGSGRAGPSGEEADSAAAL